MEDDSSSNSSSSNSSISSGSSMDMSDDNNDDDDLSDDDDISDGELSFAFSFAFDKASTIANKLNQPIEHQGIQWRRKHGLKIVELSSDDGLTFFRFRTEHLQELSDKLWPQLSGYVVGTKEKICLGKEKYSAPFETILLLCLYQLAQPNCLRREMEGFFGYKKSNMPAGVRAMLVDALYSLVIKYLHNPALFHHQIASYAHIVNA
jgi:hypothetical protein